MAHDIHSLIHLHFADEVPFGDSDIIAHLLGRTIKKPVFINIIYHILAQFILIFRNIGCTQLIEEEVTQRGLRRDITEIIHIVGTIIPLITNAIIVVVIVVIIVRVVILHILIRVIILFPFLLIIRGIIVGNFRFGIICFGIIQVESGIFFQLFINKRINFRHRSFDKLYYLNLLWSNFGSKFLSLRSNNSRFRHKQIIY